MARRTYATSKVENVFAGYLGEMGLSFATDYSVPAGTKSDGRARQCCPDMIFRQQRVAVFVDGCYWHRCEIHGPSDDPATIAIRVKDAEITAALKTDGWAVVRVWEHDDLHKGAERVAETVYRLHETRKQIHSHACGALTRTCPHPLAAWCDACEDDIHAPAVEADYCQRCMVPLVSHAESMTESLMSVAADVATDLSMIASRQWGYNAASPAEVREVLAAFGQLDRLARAAGVYTETSELEHR